MNYEKVSIIILNWNGWEDTIECLESLYHINYPEYDVIVVDNGSEDNSLEKIKDYCKGKITVKSDFFEYSPENKPIKIFEYFKEDLNSINVLKNSFNDLSPNKRLILIKNHKNYGFAEGNNIAIQFALNSLNPEYILLLNNDTVVHNEFLNKLVEVSKSDNIGAVGPKIYYYDYKGRRDVISFAGEKLNFYTSRGKRFATKEADVGQRDNIDEINTIEGSCILIKREVVEEVGMFDPVYFAYWEDTDLCTRIINAGYKLVYMPDARIWHKVGVSWDTYFSYFVQYHYLVRNRLIFMWRYASTLQKIVFSCFFALYLLVNVILMFIKEDWSTSKKGLKAIKDGIRDFNIIRNKNRE